MTPQDFITKWGAPDGVPGPAYALNEEQGAQSHFLDLCELLGVAKPGTSEGYLFEEKGAVIGGKTGFADVFMRGVFVWENKAPGSSLDQALKQLLAYSFAMSSPPILVVSDRLTIRIHTQFTGHPSQTHEVRIADMDLPDKLALLRRIWSAPESFKPKITNRDITEAAAKSFSTLAEGLRRRGVGSPLAQAGQMPGAHALRFLKSPPSSAPPTPTGESAEAAQQRANQVAHFLTQCLFCFFAEDVGLLPGRMFERLVNNRKITPDKLTQGLADLFTAMQSGGMFGADDIPWFNGGLFKTIDVPKLTILDVTELRNAANLNWSAIDVSISALCSNAAWTRPNAASLAPTTPTRPPFCASSSPWCSVRCCNFGSRLRLFCGVCWPQAPGRVTRTTAPRRPGLSSGWTACTNTACSTRLAAAATFCFSD